jgi:hypothetical protein
LRIDISYPDAVTARRPSNRIAVRGRKATPVERLQNRVCRIIVESPSAPTTRDLSGSKIHVRARYYGARPSPISHLYMFSTAEYPFPKTDSSCTCCVAQPRKTFGIRKLDRSFPILRGITFVCNCHLPFHQLNEAYAQDDTVSGTVRMAPIVSGSRLSARNVS